MIRVGNKNIPRTPKRNRQSIHRYAVAAIVESEMEWFSKVPPISSSALAHIGLEEDQALAMVPHIRAMFLEMRQVFSLAA